MLYCEGEYSIPALKQKANLPKRSTTEAELILLLRSLALLEALTAQAQSNAMRLDDLLALLDLGIIPDKIYRLAASEPVMIVKTVHEELPAKFKTDAAANLIDESCPNLTQDKTESKNTPRK